MRPTGTPGDRKSLPLFEGSVETPIKDAIKLSLMALAAFSLTALCLLVLVKA